LSSSSHFPVMAGSRLAKPVVLPPGLARLATKPLPTGSSTLANTIGIVRVACNNAAKAGALFAPSTSGCMLTSSAA
jgi:hypothetical protein